MRLQVGFQGSGFAVHHWVCSALTGLSFGIQGSVVGGLGFRHFLHIVLCCGVSGKGSRHRVIVNRAPDRKMGWLSLYGLLAFGRARRAQV